ncbi:hypothetical protein [Streptomyces microflavus]|uniref:hypothetical protein n=1 Tax=Streptomyces microflavus TaxID=1919 RepID=UPI00364F9D78
MEIFLLLAVGAAAKHTTDSVRGWLARRDQKAQDDMAAHEATVKEIAAGNYPGGTGKKGEGGQKSAPQKSGAGDTAHANNASNSKPVQTPLKSAGKQDTKGDAKAARKAAREERKNRNNNAAAGSGGGPGRPGGPGRAPVGAHTKGPGKPGPDRTGKTPGKTDSTASKGATPGAGAGSGGKGAAGGAGARTPGAKDDPAKDRAAREAKDETARTARDKADRKAADRAARETARAEKSARRKELTRTAGAGPARAGRKVLDARRDRAARKADQQAVADLKDAKDKDSQGKDLKGKDSRRKDPKGKDLKGKDGRSRGPDPAGPDGTFAGSAAKARARKAGLRAGMRAGRALQTARAYGEGFLQGFKDATDQAAREHAAAKAQEELDRTRKPMTNTPPATPVPVTAQDTRTGLLTLGTGAARKTISRGEVKTLKNFADRLGEYASTAAGAAEDCKALSGQAQEYAAQATALAEECQAVKGGDALMGTCLALAESATVQSAAAEELHTRMLRAVESLETTSANAATRHGGIFQAVADSPLSSPAERRFYAS